MKWNIDFVDSLRDEIARSSFEGERLREVGGILFGSVEAGQDQQQPKPEITVSQFLPVSIKSLMEDKSSLSRTVSEAEKIGLSVVGLYKTQLTSAPELSSRDQTLAEQLLSHKGQFLLSIYTGGTRRSSAELFFPSITEKGERLAVAFPFDRESLKRGRAKRRLRSMVRKRIPMLGLAACVIVAGILAGVLYRKTDRSAKVAFVNPPFHLLAFSKEGSINVIWNPQEKIIRDAAFGILSVQDGTSARQMILSRDTLRKGNVAYRSLAKHVRFRLQVNEVSAEIAVEAAPGAGPITKLPVLPLSAKAKPPELEVKKPKRQFSPEQPPAHLILNAKPQEFSPPPLESARVSPPTLVIPEIPVTRPEAAIAPAARPARVVYVAPEIESRVLPRTPPNVSRLLNSPVTIHVKVKLDERGNVLRAESLNRASPVEKYLSELSENAALRWHFTPARRDNSATASETVLEFRFTAQD